MCYKCWLETQSTNIISTGLLAVKGKNYEKIVTRIKSLRKHLSEAISFGTKGYSRNELSSLVDLLEQILQLDPELRARPKQILAHKFLTSE
jgi:hypothetical protein